MAGKGFTIQDLLIPYGIRLNMPPFLQSNTQMVASDVFLTNKIVSLRVHVKWTIGRVKEFRILQGNIPASMWDSVSNIIYVCCMLRAPSGMLILVFDFTETTTKMADIYCLTTTKFT